MTLSPSSSIPAAPVFRSSIAFASARALVVAAAVVWAGSGAFVVSAQQATTIEAEELKTALDVARRQLAESEARVEALESSRAALQQSLAESNRVTEEVRAQYEDLLLRMASFGVDLVKPDPKSLEQRLLSAVRDRDQAEHQKQELTRQLVQLSESAMAFLQSTVSSDPGAQAAVERELAAANEVIGMATAGPGASESASQRRVEEGQVVSIDPEVGLVVVNVGRQSGVRVGMPLAVKRDSKPVGTALVVDVRESIAGALLQELVQAGDVKVGDRIEPKPDTL